MATNPSIIAGEFQGLPALLIDTPLATAALSLHGGQLLSFVPRGFDELLWLSPLGKGAPGAIRGGVPVCWPYFGRQGQAADAPQHGFARNTLWTLVETRINAQGEALVELSLPPCAQTPLRLGQTLCIGRGLRQSLTTRNESTTTVAFTQALHGYFHVGDALQAAVTGVDGLTYTDKVDGREHLQAGDWNLRDPRDPGRSDRIYHRAAGAYVVHDPLLQRCIALSTSGSQSLVLWNPGEQGIVAISDAPAGSWRNFVCVEAANTGEDVVELAPGASHVLEQNVSVWTV